jgi:hypothetical protein
MNGEMLWLNREKGSGFIRTERAERLYVARRGFLPAPVPVARCVGARWVRADRRRGRHQSRERVIRVGGRTAARLWTPGNGQKL